MYVAGFPFPVRSQHSASLRSERFAMSASRSGRRRGSRSGLQPETATAAATSAQSLQGRTGNVFRGPVYRSGIPCGANGSDGTNCECLQALQANGSWMDRTRSIVVLRCAHASHATISLPRDGAQIETDLARVVTRIRTPGKRSHVACLIWRSSLRRWKFQNGGTRDREGGTGSSNAAQQSNPERNGRDGSPRSTQQANTHLLSTAPSIAL
jgi:hypothetical protein